MGGASDIASKVDSVFLYIFVLSAAFLVFITGLMITFVFKYSRKRGAKARDIEGHLGLEVTWTLIPLVLFLSMFYFGWTNYRSMRAVPGDALVVKTVGRQWAWDFTYPNGKHTTELYLALNRPVKLDLESADVIHGFFIPAFRVKQDVVPGQRNYTWFTPQRLGSYDIECTVICGLKHSYMLSRAHVLPEDEFKRWYFSDSETEPVSVAAAKAKEASAAAPSTGAGGGNPTVGKMLFVDRGCATCHTVDGSRLVGPSMRGLYGSSVTVVASGSEHQVTADETYLKRALLEPDAELSKGYRAGMPRLKLRDDETVDILAYIRSLK